MHNFILFLGLFSTRKHDSKKFDFRKFFLVSKNEFYSLLWLPVYFGKGTNAATMQLIASPGAHNLVVERLIKLANLLRSESDSNHKLAELWYDPSEALEFKARLLARVAIYTSGAVLIQRTVLPAQTRRAAVGRLSGRVTFDFRLGTLFFATSSSGTSFATTRIISNCAS